MSGTDVVKQEPAGELIFARSIDDMKRSLGEMNEFVADVMVFDEDYGVIPGCGDKPSLLKPGAEKLCMLYNYSPEYELITSEVGKAFIRYHFKCRLVDSTGRVRGEGDGSANSEESKFQHRKSISLNKATDEEIAAGETVEKEGQYGKYKVVLLQASPLTVDNTILKMAQKRAMVAATLCATRLSNKFTQDVEDMDKSAFGRGDGKPVEVNAEVIDEGKPASDEVQKIVTVYEERIKTADTIPLVGQAYNAVINDKELPDEEIGKLVALCTEQKNVILAAKHSQDEAPPVSTQPPAEGQNVAQNAQVEAPASTRPLSAEQSYQKAKAGGYPAMTKGSFFFVKSEFDECRNADQVGSVFGKYMDSIKALPDGLPKFLYDYGEELRKKYRDSEAA